MRLIDADAIRLKKGFFEKVDNVPKFYEWLDEQPTVDAVRVVRCKECKHFNKNYIGTFCITHMHTTNEDWYCADGERK